MVSKDMRISFIWQGFDNRYKYQWRDGLWAAMQLLEQEHEVKYFDFPLKDIHEFKPDIVLYWEAPVTNKGRDADNWFSVCALPYKKALLFAGGPLKAIDVKDFDIVFVESQINEEDCEREGIPYKRAFGVNTQIMKPMKEIIRYENKEGTTFGESTRDLKEEIGVRYKRTSTKLEKKYDGILAATFASWKRHELFAEALQSKGLAVGRVQEHDLNGYNRCKQLKVNVMGEQTPEELAKLYNQSYVAVNTAEYWGGGQRMTLEAMACGIPVIVMEDSPKNVEFVQESNGGMIVHPNEVTIRNTVEFLKKNGKEYGERGAEYVKKYWSEFEYRDSLLEGIKSIT